jgi:hypothetical protein
MICHRHNHTRQAWTQRLPGLVCLSLALANIRLGGTVAVGPVADDRAVRVCRLPRELKRRDRTVLWTGRRQIQPYATTAETCLLLPSAALGHQAHWQSVVECLVLRQLGQPTATRPFRQ